MAYKKISETELEEEYVAIKAVHEVLKKRVITKEQLIAGKANIEAKLALFD